MDSMELVMNDDGELDMFEGIKFSSKKVADAWFNQYIKKTEFIEYLEFLLSNRLHPEYSLNDLRREVEDKLKELKSEVQNG